MKDVDVQPLPLQRLAALISAERAAELWRDAASARAALGDRVVWNVNATAQGGGVAEMLQTLIAYGRGAGVDTRWLVLQGDPGFFAVTKRLHNLLHGDPGDHGALGAAERAHYERVLADNLASVRDRVRPGDVVLLHDPQTAGLVEGFQQLGAVTVWRCHIGRDVLDENCESGWDFLRPYVQRADGTIWSRQAYAPPWVDPARMRVIAPSIDPLTAKNVELAPDDVRHVLLAAGLVVDGGPARTDVPFGRRDGSTGTVRTHHGLLLDGAPPSVGDRLVVQVSRWDRLKDMAGVLQAFSAHLSAPDDVHLVLAGPDVSGVTDDPEGRQVLDDCVRRWRALPPGLARRVHLAALPMDDVDENAVIVNALQRHAAVVTQKSLVEGFGLTVTEAMWKGVPVVASAVGGIVDQIQDGVDGLLVHDPTDLAEFAAAVGALLADPQRAGRLGAAGRDRVRRQFLGDRHLGQYADLFADVVTARPAESR